MSGNGHIHKGGVIQVNKEYNGKSIQEEGSIIYTLGWQVRLPSRVNPSTKNTMIITQRQRPIIYTLGRLVRLPSRVNPSTENIMRITQRQRSIIYTLGRQVRLPSRVNPSTKNTMRIIQGQRAVTQTTFPDDFTPKIRKQKSK